MSIKLATHLYRNRHGMFYFRFVIPQDLRPLLGQREIRFSLHTEQRCEAILSAIPFIAALPQLTIDLKKMASDGKTIPPDYIQLWREQLLQNTVLRKKVKLLEGELAEQQERMTAMVPLKRAKRAGLIMHEKGQLAGKKELEDKLVFPWPSEKTVQFSELKKAYMGSLACRPVGGRKRPPTSKTIAEYDKSLDLFVKVMGDMKIGEIDEEIAGAYFQTLKKLPANISRVKAYREKSIAELLAMKAMPQSEVTCSQKIERASAMFKWALTVSRS